MKFKIGGFGIFLAYVLCRGLVAAAGDDTAAESLALYYEIANQPLESGKRLCDLEVPDYALAEDGTAVRGTLVWYFPGTGFVLDEKMELTGETGEQFVFGWNFLPAEPYQEYAPPAGQTVVTILSANRHTDSHTGQDNSSQITNGTETDGNADDAATNPSETNNDLQNTNRTEASEGDNKAESNQTESGGDGQCNDKQLRNIQLDAFSEVSVEDVEESAQSETACSNVSGQSFGATSITVVPEGTDPSSLMGSAVTGVGALGDTGQADTLNSETETETEPVDRQTGKADEDSADADSAGTALESVQSHTSSDEPGEPSADTKETLAEKVAALTKKAEALTAGAKQLTESTETDETPAETETPLSSLSDSDAAADETDPLSLAAILRLKAWVLLGIKLLLLLASA